MTVDKALRLHGAGASIRKRLLDLPVQPHMQDWHRARQSFSWDQARRAMGVEPGGTFNIAQLALDRHAEGPHGDRVAVRWLGADGRSERMSYRDLLERSNQFANVLAAAGLQRGDTLFVLLPRARGLVAAVFGALKLGLIVAPLHPQLGPEPLLTRLTLGSCRTLLTTGDLAHSLVAPLCAHLPGLEQVLTLGGDASAVGDVGAAESGTEMVDLEPLLLDASAQFSAEPTAVDQLAMLHFTSGVAGKPRGVLHAHEAALSLWMTAHLALDLHADDVYWCSVDPGDFGGLSYGVIAPLLHGVTVVLDEAGFDPAHGCDVLQQQGVTVWTTTPTVIHQLMRAGPALVRRHRFPRLRLVTSAGDALSAQAVWWGLEALGVPIHDQWWQTESGAIMIANTPAQDIKPGAMGRPLPGVDAFVVLRLPGGGVTVVDAPEAEGELAWRSAWPSMFRGYLGEDAAYRRCFATATVGELYLTGDLVRRDADGCYWFLGHARDLIKSAGHSIAPLEVESVLATHPAVSEVAVIGRPDPVLGEAALAFVVLVPGYVASQALRSELLAYALQRLGPLNAPHVLEFASQLPHARDGKLMRRLVRMQALGGCPGSIAF
jgi:acetyl-CoA synthetase